MCNSAIGSGCAGARRCPPRRNPCTGSVGAGARRCSRRRNPCIRSSCADAHRRPTRRNPCTCSSCAGARRRLIRRNPCTCNVRAGAGTASSACEQPPFLRSSVRAETVEKGRLFWLFLPTPKRGTGSFQLASFRLFVEVFHHKLKP